MNKSSKIFIAGHNGLVGSAITRHLQQKDFKNLIFKKSSELDLKDQNKVHNFFKKEKPEYVFLAAAKVGGIYANNNYPANFIYDNLLIQSNVIESSLHNNVKRLLFLGSSCIYPKNCKQPIKEKYLLSGQLELTNEPYAIAKIAGIKLCESFNRQFKTDYRSIMPTNLYGINDNFHNKNSHIIPALIKRFHDAKLKNINKVEIWGTGKPFREFLFVDDLADASIFIMKMSLKKYSKYIDERNSHVNVGTGYDIRINQLVRIIKKIVGYEGDVFFNTKMPDGTKRKLLDVSLINKMGWKYKTNLHDGLTKTYNWYIKSLEK
jgi:GDP-L-fucose synthase